MHFENATKSVRKIVANPICNKFSKGFCCISHLKSKIEFTFHKFEEIYQWSPVCPCVFNYTILIKIWRWNVDAVINPSKVDKFQVPNQWFLVMISHTRKCQRLKRIFKLLQIIPTSIFMSFFFFRTWNGCAMNRDVFLFLPLLLLL